MNTRGFSMVVCLGLFASSAFAQSFVAAGQVDAKSDASGAMFADNRFPEFASDGAALLGSETDLHLTCPFDLIQAAYDEATSNYGVAARYVTAMEVMELCNDHAEAFRVAIENEVALRERYNELFARQGADLSQGSVGTFLRDMAEKRDARIAEIEESMASRYQPLKTTLLACEVPVATLAALETPATVRFTLNEAGQIVGDVDHMTAPNEVKNAASYVAAKDVVNGCQGEGCDVDGLDLSRPFVAQIGLSGATLDIFINEEITRARQAEIEACLLDRPASNYVMTGNARAAGSDAMAALSPIDSYVEDEEVYGEKFWVRAGDEIGDTLIVSEIYVPFSDEPGEAQVVLTDCAGDYVVHMAPRSNRPTMLRPAEVTYRNRLTGEVRQPELTVIESAPFSN